MSGDGRPDVNVADLYYIAVVMYSLARLAQCPHSRNPKCKVALKPTSSTFAGAVNKMIVRRRDGSTLCFRCHLDIAEIE